MRLLRLPILFLILVFSTLHLSAVSFDLDSIAQWGKLANFCVKTYRWGDKFFNTYDSTYVSGTGTKFNIKLTTNSWNDYYQFRFNDDVSMNMRSSFTTYAGIHLSYLAISVGYEINMNKLFGEITTPKQSFNFSFNCALFSADLYFNRNQTPTKITRFRSGQYRVRENFAFQGINSDIWGIDIYYFFNNKRYSQAAAFNFGKIQKKSQGTWLLGLSYSRQDYQFDFNELPISLKSYLPDNWNYKTYTINTHIYSIKGGFAYNWVPIRNWLFAFSECPTVGLRMGEINNNSQTTLAITNIFRASVIFNYNKFFTGVVGKIYTNLTRENSSIFIGNIFSIELSVGYRFNLW